MRIPSVGQPFELKGIRFQVVKASGPTIQAKGKSEKLEIINRGNKFSLFGTKFEVESFKYSNKIITIKATGLGEDEDI